MQTTFTFKTDKKLRDAAKRTADKLGIPLTIVLNTRLREFVQNGHFEVLLTPRPEKIREWEKTSEEMERHPERQTVLRSAEEIEEHFRKVWGRKSRK